MTAASNLIWWIGLKCPQYNRTRLYTRNKCPKITCNPWKPVPKKKILPNTPSLIEKGASLNSTYWATSNIVANTIVEINPGVAFFRANNLWCDQVSVTPLLNNTTVLNKGIDQGLIGEIPIGVQCSPNSSLGDNALSKNAQKILKKNINSLKTNSKNLNLNLSIIWKLCPPARPSRTTVLVHIITVKTNDSIEITKPSNNPYFRKITPDVARLNTCTETHQG